jgi:hypothetical protein
MEKDVKTNEKCANPGCVRTAASGSRYCDTCELEWTLYRRDLRGRDREKEGLDLESR